MSKLMIPDSLKQVLLDRWRKTEPDSETDHEWTIERSSSEWSGYHDEVNCYSNSLSVLDHDPVPDNQGWHHTETLPQTREMYEQLFHGYDIEDLYSLDKYCDYYDSYYKTIIKLDCPDPDYQYTKPLWILIESHAFR